jgi:ABC-2 type transport system ATP-binding protein
MLELKNLTKIYAKSEIKSVDDLNLSVNDGEIFGFLGPNGAGKSTTIKMITGILQPTAGEIYFDGKALSQNKLEIKRQIGYVPDSSSVYDKMTGKHYINFMGEVYGVPLERRIERSERFLEMFELKSAVNDQIKSYSHGMRQKIVVIGALLHTPKLWILDEPLTGLDPQSAFQLKEYMRQHVKEGNTVFFSSHIIDVVEKICDRVGIINNGALVTVGTIEELKAKNGGKSLEEIFLSITSKV